MDSIRVSRDRVYAGVMKEPNIDSSIQQSAGHFSNLSNPSLKSKILPRLLKHQIENISSQQEQVLILAAYRGEGQAGHGNVDIEGGAVIQGYVADLPDGFDVQSGNTPTRSCKSINQDNNGDPATVCVGSDNQIPVDGDVDFIASDGEWYKIRTGTAVVSKDPDTGIQSVEPKGLDLGLPYGVYPNFDWNPDGEFYDNASQSGNVVHKVNESPIPWNKPPKSDQPIQYLNRLNNEEGLGPLPISPPAIITPEK